MATLTIADLPPKALLFRPADPNPGWTYSPQKNIPYSLYSILRGQVPEELRPHLSFVDPGYFEVLKKCGQRLGKSGRGWLEEFFQLNTTLMLNHRTQRNEVSPELKFIARERPEFLLGTLQGRWTKSSHQLLQDTLEGIKVPILLSKSMQNLKDTYLPLPELKEIAASFGVVEEFGFIKEIDGFEDLTKFTFLQELSVGIKEDFYFWVKVLKRVRIKDSTNLDKMVDLYSNLQSFCRVNDDLQVSTLR